MVKKRGAAPKAETMLASQPDQPFRVVSWNVNGIRSAVSKGYLDWLAASGADVVGLQETRIEADAVDALVASPAPYSSHWKSGEKKGYSGVGFHVKRAADAVKTKFEHPVLDDEGRLIEARFGELTIVNGYFPNGSGKDRDNSRVPYKLEFYQRLFDSLEKRRARGDRILVMGDMNTAHRAIDLARPKQNEKTSGFLPEEREELDRWIRSGWVDTFRHFEPGEGHYSWWSQRFGVREKNIGWRIDYVLASHGAMPFLRGAKIHPDVKGSDHCPVSVDLDPAVLGAGRAK